jgi:hypothetical protein
MDVVTDVLEDGFGGVCERVGSCMVVLVEPEWIVLSGDRFGGVGCGIVESNISALSKVENVRFASSAICLLGHAHVAYRQCKETNSTHFSGNEAHRAASAFWPLKAWLVMHHHAAG